VLNAVLSRGHFSGPDRSLVTDLVYGALRFEIAVDACLAPLLKTPEKLPAEVRDILRLGGYELLVRGTPKHAAVNEWVEVTKGQRKKLSSLVNAVLRRVSWLELPLAQRYGLPEWLFSEWVGLFGEAEALEAARNMLTPEPLWLLAYHPDAAESLQAEGCEVAPGPLPPRGFPLVSATLAVRPDKPLNELEAFKRGWVQPQNPASTLPVRLLETQAGERVLDLAAGSGVKTAQLAAAGADVVGLELHPKKLARAEKNLERLDLRAELRQADLRTLPDLAPAAKVLLDAPCSGSGTLRGHPELRTRLTPQTAEELAGLQRELLETAVHLTEPGGLLLYSVCALSEAEGIGMARWFLARHADFHAEPLGLELPHVHFPEGDYILPLNGLDGFFITRLRRETRLAYRRYTEA
jgi:16S rRNA (cytosine967-C5)-methyltransferase